MTLTTETRPWNEVEIRVLWAEANREIWGDAAVDAWAHQHVFATDATYQPVARTIVSQPGADDLMEVLRGTPPPAAR